MIKKIFFLICFASFLQACDDKIYYTGDTRILLQGRILNQNNEPLQGIPLTIFIEKGERDGWFIIGPSLADEDVISYTTTDGNGYYKMIIPKPENYDNISMLINQSSPAREQNTDYSNTVITDISISDAEDYTLNFSEQKLFKLQDSVALTITVNNVPDYLNGNLPTNFSGLIHNKIITLDEPFSYNLYLESTTYQNNYSTIKYTFTVAKNQVLAFKYRRNASNETVEHLITVGNEPLNYNLNY